MVAADATLQTNLLAQCLSSATISLNADCDVTISSSVTDNIFVPSIWSNGGTYAQYKLCPETSPAAITAAKDGNDDPLAGAVLAAIKLALDGYIYGFNGDKTAALISSKVNSVTLPQEGQLIVSIGTTTPKDLAYAIRAIDGTTTSFGANAVVSSGAGFTNGIGGEYIKDDDNAGTTVGDSCDAGRVGIMLSTGIKLCALCPAGTYSTDGNGCMGCAAGTASGTVGADAATTCGACTAGQYAQDGECRASYPLGVKTVPALGLLRPHTVRLLSAPK